MQEGTIPGRVICNAKANPSKYPLQLTNIHLLLARVMQIIRTNTRRVSSIVIVLYCIDDCSKCQVENVSNSCQR